MRILKRKKQNGFLTYIGLAAVFTLLVAVSARAQAPKPSDIFGFEVGADYKLAGYNQMLTYYNKLEAASDRVKKIKLGKTVDGRTQILLFISSNQNIQQLDKWRNISEKLARARIGSAEAQKLANEGKAIVWIDGGMHASELAHGQMTPELAYRVATEETPEMQHIRQNVILLLMPVMNPDGLDMVKNWYDQNLGTPYENSRTPWLWQRYVGHDNNRDWFMGNMPETRNVMKILYQKWYPQIVYNHHQDGSNWAPIFVPPFADPVNKNIHPGITTAVNEVGAAMANRFAMKEMPGVISNAGYTMFWDGGGRTVPFYHNQIGILTEVSQNSPTPSYYDPEKRPEMISGFLTDSTSIFYPDPWLGGELHFRDAVDYMLTASMAVLNYAADRRQNLLQNIYRMGRDAIAKGEEGEPYAYIIPEQQWDDLEADNLVNILLRGGLEVEQAGEGFSAGGKQYAAGSYILYAAQPFRPYLVDLLDVQYHPTRYQYPGGPPKRSYDVTGWTLPIQMGVAVDRINDSFEVKTDKITKSVTSGKSTINGDADYGFWITPKYNASFKAVNILLKKGANISRVIDSSGDIPTGAFIVTGADASDIEHMGLPLHGLAQKPDVESTVLTRPKVGIYKSWIQNIDEGWTYWLMQQYNFEVDTLHNADIKNGNLQQYSSIIIPSQSPESILNGYSIQEMPEKYTGGLGPEGTLALKRYTEAGGTLIAFDKASHFVVKQFGLPLRNATGRVSSNNFFIPGSLIRAVVDTDSPIAWGMQDTVSASFIRSFAFEIATSWKRSGISKDIPDPPKPQVDVIVNYADSDLIMSGGGIGAEKYIGGKPAMVRVTVGKGQAVLFAFRPQFRGQSHGTYKLIFNAIISGAME